MRFTKQLLCFLLLCMGISANAAYEPVDGVLRIPDGVRSISRTDVINKTEIKKLILPADIMSIMSFTFQSCSNIEEVIFLGNVPSFGEGAFYGCSGITRVEVQPGYINSLATAASDYDWDRPGGQGQAILYEGNTPVIDLHLSGRVAAFAFRGFKNAFKVHLDDVTNFGESVFWGRNVESFYVNNLSTWCSSSSIGRLFYEDTKLYVNNQLLQGDVVIPSDITRIGASCFNGYNFINSITIPSNITYISYNAFAGSSIKWLKSSCPVFSQDAVLSGCSQLEEITFDSGALNPDRASVQLGEKCFSGCTSLKIINLDHSYFADFEDTKFPFNQIERVYVSDIETWCKGESCLGSNAVLYINGIIPTQLEIPDGVPQLNDKAFYNQPYELITIPQSVTWIGNNALSNVKNITIKAINPPTAFDNTFSNVNKTTAVLTVPKNRESAYRSAEYWKDFSNIQTSTFGQSIPATAVSLSQSEIRVEVGQSVQLTSTITPLNATDSFVWSSANDNIASLADGLITAKAPGTVLIKFASIDNPAIVATCNVRVYKPITSLSFDSEITSIHLGEKKALNLSIEPIDASINEIAWSSSNSSIVAVDEYGNITGLKGGSATITAKTTDGTNIEASCTVNVIQLVTGIELDIYSQNLAVNSGSSVSAIISPSDASNKELVWTVEDESIARLTDTSYGYKIIWGVKAGKTKLTVSATDGSNVSASAEFTVYNEVSSLTLTDESIKVVRGDTYQLDAVVEPSDAWYQDLEWSSSNPEIVSVDENGLLTTHAKGDARIYVKTKFARDDYNQEFMASCFVQVIVLTETIEMTKPEATINIGESLLLRPYVKVTPDDATNIDRFRWESDNTNVATVTVGGAVIGVSQGQATITAYTVDGTNMYVTCLVTVVQPVTGIVLNETDATLNEGQTVQLTATVSPELADNKTLQWTSSNEAVATVDQSGLVTAISQGSAVITVSSTDGSDVSATCNITVRKLVSDIVLNETDATLNEGQTVQLTATVSPELADNKALQWTSSNEAVATVDPNGLVTAVAQGNAIITVSSTDGSDVSASCNITVRKLVSDIVLNETDATLNEGQTVQLTATVSPELADNNALQWTSSNEAVATVDQSGLVTAISQGSAVITVSSTDGSDVSANCNITVNRLVGSITLSESEIVINKGEYYTLVATVVPSDATDTSLVWSSSDTSVARVQDGKVIGIADGEATIFVIANDGSGASASCNVTVRTLVTEIILSENNLSLKEGEFKEISATVLPDDATNTEVVWTSSDESVATVQNGLILAHKLGTAIISVEATDGSGVYAECTVEVTDDAGIADVNADGVYITTEPLIATVHGTTEDTIIRMFDMSGKTLYIGNEPRVEVAQSGIYILVVNNKTYKIKL